MLNVGQKAQVRLYLGYPDRFRYKDTRLESMLENLSPEADVQVGTILLQVAQVDAALLEDGVDGAGVKRVDEIWFENGWRRVAELKKLGRQYVSRISIVTGVPIYSDYFGTAGYLGDSFSGLGGSNRGGGFYGLG